MDPVEVIYVGDSVKHDVRSAEAAGITPLHFDPLGLCNESDYFRIARIAEALHYV